LARLRFTPAALEDLERLSAFLRDTDPIAAAETIPLILDGLKVLAKYPLIGRPIDVNRRELVVFRGRTGYLVQYAFGLAEDEAVILAVRHQREVDVG
jgi:plasmid stabilization system protein ParE